MTKTPHSSETETATESTAEQRSDEPESESESESTAQTDDFADTEFGAGTDTDTGSAFETGVASSDAVLERDGNGSETGTAAAAGPILGSTKIRRYLVWGALGGCAVLTLVATVQFYWSVGAAIDLWVDRQYRPVMHAAFNLVVLLGSLIGISLLVRDLN